MRRSLVVLTAFALLLLVQEAKCRQRIAIVGEGVIGLNTATAILDLAEKNGLEAPTIEIFHHKDFNQILSRHIAGLFRIDTGSEINKKYGEDTFKKLASLWREYGGVSGVQLISGHILTNVSTFVQSQRESYGKIVYNFRELNKEELFGENSPFDARFTGATHGLHYTAYTSEGLKFCPFLKHQLREKGVLFKKRNVTNLEELGQEFDVVVNCAGLYGGILAGDDGGNVYPIRGVLLGVNAPWQKHFLYKETRTITIPVIDTVYLGTVKQDHTVQPLSVTAGDITDIINRYVQLQPSFKNVSLTSSFVGHRPARKQVRVESEMRTVGHKKFKVVHNYGHGGNGFTLAYGSAKHAATLVLDLPTTEYDGITPPPLPTTSVIPWWAHMLQNHP